VNVTATHHIILVLWGQGFDEIAASIFVAELRRLGKRVKLVGLNSQHIAGQHGVTLVPDLPLGQALRVANRIQCLIVPAALATLQQFSYDPRLAELLGLATSQQALIVINTPEAAEPPAARSFFSGVERALEYPATPALVDFVQMTLSARLA
jgi:hypothetical protein